MGVLFDPWQDAAGRLILAKRANGKLAASVGGVGMSLPRQVGKTYLVGALTFAMCINRPGTLVIWSAHHARTHAETFRAMQAFAKRSRISPYVDQIFLGSGDEEIRFGNGSRILFGARERGFGRGIPGVDVLIMDEAQILSDRALDNMLATLNTSSLGLHLYIGTPPRPEDNSETFSRMRQEALDGTSDDLVWIEFGADPDSDPDDRKQWAKANPSYPTRTPAESILRLKKKLGPESFDREGRGIWSTVRRRGVFGAAWEVARDEGSVLVGPRSVAVDVAPDGAYSSVAACGRRGDGRWHVEMRRERGLRWVGAAVADQLSRHEVSGPVVLAGRQAAALRDSLEADGRDVLVMSAGDFLAACAQFADSLAADDPDVRHIGQPELDAAVAGAAWKDTTDGRYLNRRGATDICPLIAVVAARWAAVRSTEADYDVLESIW